MIIYDLDCAEGHAFEGWFDTPEEFSRQQRESLLVCPTCGCAAVQRRPHASAIAGRAQAPAPAPADVEGRLRELVFQAAAAIKARYQDVGVGFAEEARRIHRGDAAVRPIRGTTSPAEERALTEEGVPFVKLALPEYDA